MGLVLDSGVLIAAEREAKPVSELPATLEQAHGENWSTAFIAPTHGSSATFHSVRQG